MSLADIVRGVEASIGAIVAFKERDVKNVEVQHIDGGLYGS